MESVKKQKAKSDDKPNKEECKCGACLEIVQQQDSGVMCEICNSWYHSKCQGISDQLYQMAQNYIGFAKDARRGRTNCLPC